MRRKLIIEIECESVRNDGSDFYVQLEDVTRKVLEGYTVGSDLSDYGEWYRYCIIDNPTPADLE